MAAPKSEGSTKPGFGSFNSGNADDMIRSDEWVPPERPLFIQELVVSQETFSLRFVCKTAVPTIACCGDGQMLSPDDTDCIVESRRH
eukprot:3426264-Rhodomonas_salina.2